MRKKLKCKIKYYRRYQIIVEEDRCSVVCKLKEFKGCCIPFTKLETAKNTIDGFIDKPEFFKEEYYFKLKTNSVRR